MDYRKEHGVFKPKKINLKKIKTQVIPKMKKKEAQELLETQSIELVGWQEKLFAESKHSLLIVLQAIDAAGKDSMIEHVMRGVNPQYCEVTSFKTPTSTEYNHDFLWRHYLALPEKGKTAIHNRSHYESVLVCKVHPEYNLSEKYINSLEEINAEFWKNRYESINDFEKHLSRNGTKVIKLFLHLSKDEQKQRFLDRINETNKNWKFLHNDLKERALWESYQQAYTEMIEKTATENTPWYIIPADDKPYARVAVQNIIIETLKEMNPQFPNLNDEELASLNAAKIQLEKEE